MQKNFFTGRSQLYKNNNSNYDSGVRVSVSIGNTYVSNHVTIITSDNYDENDDYDDLKPLFTKLR